MDYWQKFEYEEIYHIYNRSVENQNLFSNSLDYSFFLKKYLEYFGNYFKTYAYCLIPNHFHLLIRVKKQKEVTDFICNEKTNASSDYVKGKNTINEFLEDQMRRFYSSYSLKYNNRHNRRGPLLAPRFKRIQVRTESKLMHLLCYIHHNPIHHNLVDTYEGWRYSSYCAYLKNVKSRVDTKEVLTWLHGLQEFGNLHLDFKVNYKELTSFDTKEYLDR